MPRAELARESEATTRLSDELATLKVTLASRDEEVWVSWSRFDAA